MVVAQMRVVQERLMKQMSMVLFVTQMRMVQERLMKLERSHSRCQTDSLAVFGMFACNYGLPPNYDVLFIP